jgi:hypothetical protein
VDHLAQGQAAGQPAMNERSVIPSKTEEFREVMELLTTLLETANRLPIGSERDADLSQIYSFRRRLAGLLARNEKPPRG